MTDRRVATASGRLARLGFVDAERSADCVARLGPGADELVHLLAVTADPDQALAYLADLADRVQDRQSLLEDVVDDEGTAMRLLSVLGASSALGDHLLRHPEHYRDLTDPLLGSTRPTAYAMRADLMTAVGADPAASTHCASSPDATGVGAPGSAPTALSSSARMAYAVGRVDPSNGSVRSR